MLNPKGCCLPQSFHRPCQNNKDWNCWERNRTYPLCSLSSNQGTRFIWHKGDPGPFKDPSASRPWRNGRSSTEAQIGCWEISDLGAGSADVTICKTNRITEIVQPVLTPILSSVPFKRHHWKFQAEITEVIRDEVFYYGKNMVPYLLGIKPQPLAKSRHGIPEWPLF